MNNSITPGLMKKMKHPITKRYCNNPTKQVGAATHAVGHNRTDNVLQQRGVKTDIYSIPDGSPNPKPISMSLLGGKSVPRTSDEASAIVTIESNERSGRNKPDTKDKNIGTNTAGRYGHVAQHGSPLEQKQITHDMVDGKIIYPQITAKDSSNIKKAYQNIKMPDIAKTTTISHQTKKPWDDVTAEDIENYTTGQYNILRGLASQYSLPAVKGVAEHYGLDKKPKNL